MAYYKEPLDSYDRLPSDMVDYLKHNGYHFNKKMLEWAVGKMRRLNPSTNKMERIELESKEKVDEQFKAYGIVLENNDGMDYLYIYHMAKADFYKSSLPDEKSLVLFVKDYIDDPDLPDGGTFVRFYASMCHAGVPIPWSEML